MIECVGVTYTYPSGVRALDALDLRIDEGERVAVVGQNGSGKTTLVRHFNGLLRPAAGRVLVGGRDTRETPIAALSATVGLTFQDPDRQIFAGSVEAEVAFGPRNRGFSAREVGAAVGEALDAVGLERERKTNPYDLGFTRRKLLTIASVLAMRTPVVVLDEPTTGQDLRGARLVREVVASVAAEGRSVVAITHDMAFAAESFGRIVVMRGGRIVLDGTPAEVFAEDAWPVLRSTNLEPTYAALTGVRLGLGATPTADALVAALASRQDSAPG